VLTILGWSSRLAVSLVTGSEHELLFVRGFTRYSIALKTFSTLSNAPLTWIRCKIVGTTKRNRVRPPPAYGPVETHIMKG